MYSIQLNTQGSLMLLENKIKTTGIDISTTKLMQIMPEHISNLELPERNIFTSYYWRRMSINEISKQYGQDAKIIKRILENATNVFIHSLCNVT